ncbi:hypothetical protein, partial [Kocuria flava]|uniref:hypothetical protein n=1 Tax=Kocuria flava TaxID=446860 RepID=UPI002F946307
MGDKKTEKQVFENLSLSDLATMFIDVILDGQDKFQNPIERPDGSWGLQSPIVQNPDSSQIPARVDGFKITTPIEFVDQFLTFYWGPASAAADVATEDDNWKQIINIPAVAGAVGEKYANAYHILMTRVAGVELSKTALTIARAVKIPGQVGLLILWGEIWYEGGGWVDKKVNASGWIVGKLPDPVGLDPSEYPLATIYKYIEQDAMIPYLVAKEIKEGLEKQGRGWPTFEEYPLYLRQHITERNIALFRDFLTWSIESAARAEEWLDIGETSEPKIIEENADQPPEPSDGLHQQGVTIAAGEEQACYAQDPTLEAPNPAADSQETAAGEEQACYAQDPTLEAPNPAADSQE